jgi:hypothetical protein
MSEVAPLYLARPPVPPRPPVPAERRASRRYLCGRAAPVRFIVRPSYQPFHAIIRDVSVTGVGLLALRPPVRGALVVLQLVQPEYGGGLTRLARVVRVQRRGWIGRWMVGLRFVEPLGDEELEALRRELGAPA